MRKQNVQMQLHPSLCFFRRGPQVFAINQATLRWMAIPATAAALFQEFDGRRVEEVRTTWPSSAISFNEFLGLLSSADGLVGSIPTPVDHRTGRSAGIRPQVRILKIVEGCNLACNYCYDEATTHIRKTSIAQIRQTIDFIIRHRARNSIHFHFHGGEPLLNWEALIEGVSYARETTSNQPIDVSFAVGTNGTLLTDARLNWLIENDVAIRISYDGPAHLHDSFRPYASGRGSARRVEEAIDELCRRTAYRNWTVLTTVTNRNASHILDFTRDLEIRGVPEIQFQPCRRQGFAALDPAATITSSAYLNILETLAREVDNGAFQSIRLLTLLQMLHPLLSGESTQGGCSNSRCGAGDELMAFDADGTIGACDTIPKGSLRTIGRIDANIIDFSRSTTQAAVDRIPECRECPWLRACKGGCPGAAMTDNGQFFAKHSFTCDLSMGLYPALIELLASSDALLHYYEKHLCESWGGAAYHVP